MRATVVLGSTSSASQSFLFLNTQPSPFCGGNRNTHNTKTTPHKTMSFALIYSPQFLYSQINPKKSTIYSLPRKSSPISYIKSFNFICLCSTSPFPAKSDRFNSFSRSISAFDSIKPYLVSEWKLILRGWAFSAVSAISLSKIIPISGKIPLMLNDFDAIRGEGFSVAGLVAVRVVACYLQQAFLWEAALNAVYGIRVHVFEKVLQRDLGFFEGGDGVLAGDIAYRITAEASDVADSLFSVLNAIVPSTLQLVAMGAQMLAISPALSLVSALVIPFMALVTVYFGKMLRAISRDAHLSIAELSAYLNEVFPSILFVKANDSEWSESARFNKLAHTDLTKRLKKRKMKALVPQILQVIYFGALFVVCAGSRVLFDGSRLLTFMSSLVFLIEPIQGVGKAYNELKQGEPAIERLFDLARFNPQVTDKPDAINLDYVSGEVNLCDVSFQYGDDLPFILSGVDLHVKAGETVALVGPSGGGKTTLVKLLLRLYNPSSGCISIDGFDIRSIGLGSLRKHVGLVSQDTMLFSGTVAENIGYKDLMTKIDLERVKIAAMTANAEEFITRLSDGYNTNIGPRGSLLSGGQKQRLAIARALYQDPSILVLDEATSALDSLSELLVRRALERVMKNRTVLIVAHRLESGVNGESSFPSRGWKAEGDRSFISCGWPSRVASSSWPCSLRPLGSVG
ncbi:hypothetical protein Dimus_006992 [Dionaea muscipula]